MTEIEEEKREIFLTIKGFISEIIGEDVAEELDISVNSSFTKDLEMDSIQIVSFAEKVNRRYGERVDFTGWLSDKSIMQLLNMTIGKIVDFIANADN